MFSNVWSENTALFERLMEIHSNSPKLYYGFKALHTGSRGLLHKTFYRRKLWLKLKTRVSTILPLTKTQEKTQVKNNLSFR